MDSQYIDKMKVWLEIDNKVIKLKEQLNELTDEKKELEDEILQYVEENALDKVKVNISDGTLKFAQSLQKQALSMKLLKTVLTKYNEESEGNKRNHQSLDVDEIIKFISSNLESKSKKYIKRDVR